MRNEIQMVSQSSATTPQSKSQSNRTVSTSKRGGGVGALNAAGMMLTTRARNQLKAIQAAQQLVKNASAAVNYAADAEEIRGGGVASSGATSQEVKQNLHPQTTTKTVLVQDIDSSKVILNHNQQRQQQEEEQLPRHISHRQINENILVLPLQLKKRRQLQKNESQTSKKSLCLQETFPETLITLNKEILEKRLSSVGNQSGYGQSNNGSTSGLNTARESFKTLIPTDEAVKGSQGPRLNINETTSKDNRKNKVIIQSSVSRKMPPRVPQTTRNVVKINNFMANSQLQTTANQKKEPIKFNFKKLISSNRRLKLDQV